MRAETPPTDIPNNSQPSTNTSLDPRLETLRQWLSTHTASYRLDLSGLAPASNDASFRRYFRLPSHTHGSLIVMDAPPHQEDCHPFVKVAALFAAAGVNVPHVLEQDFQQGFLLLTDLGQSTYLERLTPTTAPQLYGAASAALIQIQTHSRPDVLPAYDRPLLLREMNLFPEWYLNQHLQLTLSPTQHTELQQVFDAILANNLAQPTVWVHRDYHSRNLMVVDEVRNNPGTNPGILDFQDAVYGPITYDLVSLLRDAYIEWPEEQVLDWVIRHWEKARQVGLPVAADVSEFYRDFEWMGLQRFLKVLGIFARLAHRDGKQRYLDDLPVVLRYTRHVAERYGALKPLLKLLDAAENKAAQVGYTF